MLEILRRLVKQRRRSARPRPASVGQLDQQLEIRQLLSATTVQLTPSQDNAIYQDDVNSSNGAGEFLPVGSGIHSLLQFSVDNIPSGSTIIDAVLTLNAIDGASGSTEVSVHPLESSWGAAGSNAPGNELTGANAQEFDATWIYSSFDGEVWNSPGGDFAGATASAAVDGNGFYEWIGNGLIDDVQAWVDDPTSNFGWLLQGAGSWKSFISSDAPDSGLGPILEVTYEGPPPAPIVLEGRIWNDLNSDGRRDEGGDLSDLGLTILNGNSYHNGFGGNEYWYWSSGQGGWYFLTPDGTLTQWSGQGGQLTGTEVATLDPIYYENPGLLTQTGEGQSEPWLNGWTVEALNGAGEVVATTVTAGRDTNGDGAISPEEWGWYSFDLPGDQTYTVRAEQPDGWSETGKRSYASSSGGNQAVNEPQLEFRVSFYLDYGGLNEKWMWNAENGWYYITPDGDLYRWNGVQPSETNPLSGQLVTSPGVAYYNDPLLLAQGGYSGPTEPEDSISRTDVGVAQTQTVSGRSFLDMNENGIRDFVDLFTARFANTVYPDHVLAEGEHWFLDTENMDWYIINSDGEPRFFGPAESGPSWADSVVGGVQAEPWLNGRTMELVNEDGVVVDTTQTRSIDLNDDGTIQVNSERGWYVFDAVPAGNYTVRMQAEAGWVNEQFGGSQSDALAAQLDAQHGFRETTSDFHNWGGLNERWIIDQANEWYYILEDGSLYKWSAGTGRTTGLEGTLVGNLSTAHYTDLSRITDPQPTGQTVTVSSNEDPLELIFSSHRLLDDLRAL